MNEMLERVARAISKSEIQDEGGWEAFLPEAFAAIEAMRDPTNDMLRGLLVHRGYDPDAKEETLDTLGNLDVMTMGTYVAAYSAMISAALSSAPIGEK